MWDLLLQQTANGIAQGTGYAIIALGLTTVYGVLHIINFAHGELYMVGGLAAVVAASTLGQPYAVALVAAVVVAATVAALVDLAGVAPVLRQRDGQSTVLLTTFAISILINESVLATWGPLPVRIEGVKGLTEMGPVVISNQRIFLVGAGFVLLCALEYLLRRTLVGKHIRAVADSAYAAQVVGIDVRKIRSVVFIGAGALAGLTGALMVPITLFAPSIGHNVIINAFVVVVVGGMGSAVGAIACGISLGLLEAYSAIFMPQQLGAALIYGVLLLTLLVRPTGLFSGVRA